MNSLRTLRFTFNDSRFIAALIFVCTLALYVRTTAPTLGGAFDSEEFQHVAYNLDIAHSTGYPLYLILGKIFTTLVPIGNIAYRMNLLSAVIGAAAAAVVYLNAFVLTRRHTASIASAALFATNSAVWRQAGVASVGPLHLLLLAAILLAILLWREKRAHPEQGRRMPLSVVAFLFGLGLAHHRTTFWLAIPIAILVLLDDAQILRRPRDIAKNLFWLALPLLLYLYMPIFGNDSPWYSNTLQGFLQHISGSDASDFIRDTPPQMIEGISLVSRYLFDSFGYWGIGLILLGVAINLFRAARRHSTSLLFCLGIATFFFYLHGAFYAGEPDRYLQMPFAFLIYWFALGVGAVQDFISARFVIPSEARNLSKNSVKPIAHTIVAVTLAILLALPFPNRFRIADWSMFDRVYKQWNEIFTLPIPENATIVGNWGQLNAMRYMQRIEHRRPDLRFVGTLYDPAPQTDAAQEAFAQGRAIFISPGLPQPIGEYRYAQIGPLLEVRDKPQMQAPAAQENISITPSLTLANDETTTALESYAPTTSIAPNRTARVTLDWRVESSVKDFLVRVKLYDPDNRLIAQKDEPPVRGLYPTSQWTRGEFVRDVHNVLIPAGAPPGKYALKLLVIDAATKQSIGDEIALASFAIERATNLTREQVFIAHPLDLALSDRLVLGGYGGFEGEHRAGESIGGNLIFFARENIDADLTLQFALIDPSGKTIESWQRRPIDFYPTREWQRGEILKAYYDLPLAKDLPHGEYSFAVGIGRWSTITNKIQIAP